MAKFFEFVNSSAKKAFQELPKDIQIQFANDLQRVQEGLSPLSDFKHLKGIGNGVVELIENGSPAYRAVYCAKYLDTVFILHAFTKTTNGVDRKAMETVQDRHKTMMQIVKSRK
ncbi:type II toxin-antitoxin system RelE/ParE family toxin [Neorhizobium sp. DT-125]|uniref:type II toxin-antitoxin system RelE/ParE family toxin n=1 Tax=Neorhizobium sp. DT-125 TaxID=3396163 RepID=UPI003F1A278B